MIAPRAKGMVYLQSFLEACIAFSFFWVYLLLFMMVRPGGEELYIEGYGNYAAITAGAIILHGVRMLYQKAELWGGTLKASHSLALNQVFNVTVAISLFLVMTKDKGISRAFLITFLPVLYSILLVANLTLPKLIARSLYRNRDEPTILIGSAKQAESLAGWLLYQQNFGMRVVGLISDEPTVGRPEFPRLAALPGIRKVIQEKNITQAILIDLPEHRHMAQEIVGICENLGVRLLVLSNFDELFKHKVNIIEDAGRQFIGLRPEPLESPHNRVLKRALDLAISIPVVFLVLPVLTMVVWIFQRLQSPGPVFYSQMRAGLQNKPFQILKFRTMHQNNRQAEQARDGDARIYPAGKWLRKLSVDELPQFVNVLRGEMSVVGPRPHLVEHNAIFADVMKNYSIRSMVKPGITGLAQVRGFRGETKCDEDIVRRVESDIFYLESWSFSLDLIILLRTFRQVFAPPKNAV